LIVGLKICLSVCLSRIFFCIDAYYWVKNKVCGANDPPPDMQRARWFAGATDYSLACQPGLARDLLDGT